MKALVVNAPGREFDLEDVDIAAPIGREVLVKRASPGLCHTDLLFTTHDIVPMPAVLGHEVAGTVAAVGPDAAQVRVGDHVVRGHERHTRDRAGLSQTKDGLILNVSSVGGLVSLPAIRSVSRNPSRA